jgi:SAM-dependent methyltransferase
MVQKRAMAGQRIPLTEKLRNGWQIFKEHRSNAWGGAQTYVERYRLLSGLLDDFTDTPVASSRVLEVGCGQRAIMPLVFAAHGAEAHGVDVEVPTYRMSLPIFLKIIRRNGIDRACKSLTRHILFDRAFLRNIERAFDLERLPYRDITIRVMDAAALDYPDNHFDLISSFAAFEHIADADSALAHINRMLKPDGIALIHIHLFPSLSGGHHLEWQRPDENPSKLVPPWDHLRDNRYPANTFLNKMKIGDYQAIFERHTVPRRVSFSREGLSLTHRIPESLLERYTLEDLTTKGAVYIFSKKE